MLDDLHVGQAPAHLSDCPWAGKFKRLTFVRKAQPEASQIRQPLQTLHIPELKLDGQAASMLLDLLGAHAQHFEGVEVEQCLQGRGVTLCAQGERFHLLS